MMRRSVLLIVALSALPFIVPLARHEVFTFRDHADYFVPLRAFTASALREGVLPLWNPYNACGERWLANPQTGVFYPPTWLFAFLPFSTAYIAYLWLHAAILGCGGFVLLRRVAPDWAARIGGVTLALGGPSLSLLDVNNNFATFAWFPAALHAALLRSDRSPRLSIGSCAVAVTMMFLGGEPWLAFVGAVVCAIVMCVRGQSNRRWLDPFAIAVLAAALSAIQLVPFLESLEGSDRLAGFEATGASTGSLDPREWIALGLTPAVSISPGVLDSAQYFILSLYLGPLVLTGLLATFLQLGILLRGPQRLAVAGSLGLAAVMAILAAGKFIPGLTGLLAALPVNVSRFPSRVAPFCALAIVVLATIGIASVPRARRAVRMAAFLGAVGLTAIASITYVPDEQVGVRALEPVLMFALTGLVFLSRSSWLSAPRTSWVTLLVIAADLTFGASALLRSAHFSSTVTPYAQILDRPMRLVRLPETQRAGRGFLEERLRSLSGYLNLLDRRFDLSTAAPVVPQAMLEVENLVIREARLDLLDFLSVGWVVSGRDLPAPRFHLVAKMPPVAVFENRGALPMITFHRSFIEVPGEQVWLSMIRERGTDPRREVVLSGHHPELRVALARARTGAMDARATWRHTWNRVTVDVTTTTSTLVVLNQADAPGWNVTIDGKASRALRANGLFRAVEAPAGVHQIVWAYQPDSLKLGALASVFAALVILLDAIAFARRRTGPRLK